MTAALQGNSEISSCNYAARARGVKNGIWMQSAREKCPDLVRIPYEFEEYRTASHLFYGILGRYTTSIQAVSMDEAFLDLTGEVEVDHLEGFDALVSRLVPRFCVRWHIPMITEKAAHMRETQFDLSTNCSPVPPSSQPQSSASTTAGSPRQTAADAASSQKSTAAFATIKESKAATETRLPNASEVVKRIRVR